jgi:hypothetical protein
MPTPNQYSSFNLNSLALRKRGIQNLTLVLDIDKLRAAIDSSHDISEIEMIKAQVQVDCETLCRQLSDLLDQLNREGT